MFGENPEAQVHFLHIVPKLQNVCPIDIDVAEGTLNGMDEDPRSYRGGVPSFGSGLPGRLHATSHTDSEGRRLFREQDFSRGQGGHPGHCPHGYSGPLKKAVTERSWSDGAAWAAPRSWAASATGLFAGPAVWRSGWSARAFVIHGVPIGCGFLIPETGNSRSIALSIQAAVFPQRRGIPSAMSSLARMRSMTRSV